MTGEAERPPSSAPLGNPRAGSGRGVCGILVTFNPKPGLLGEVLQAANEQLDHLIVIDNGSELPGVEAIRQLSAQGKTPGPPSMTVLYHPANLGLPIRFNEAIRFARDAGYRFVLLLDQDSVLQPGAIRSLLGAYDRVSAALPVGALEALNEEPFVLPTDDFLAGYWRRMFPRLPGGLSDDFLGTNSGLFLPLAVLGRVGGFDESYFLDAVDFEFSLRLRSAGLRVLQVPEARIRHQRGETGPSTGSTPRPPVRRVLAVRHYYVARDVLRTWARYRRRFPLVGLLMLSMPFREALLVLLYYPDRATHWRYLGLGAVHALRGVTGPLPTSAR
jgi:rhamnosyltransferase